MKTTAVLTVALTLFLAVAAQARPTRETAEKNYDAPQDEARLQRLVSLLAARWKASGDEIGEATEEAQDRLHYHRVNQSDLSVLEDARQLHLDGRSGYLDYAFMLEDYADLRGKGFSRQKVVRLLNRRYDTAYASKRQVARLPTGGLVAEHETRQEQERNRRLTSSLAARFKISSDDAMEDVIEAQYRLHDGHINQSYLTVLEDAVQLHAHDRTGYKGLEIILKDYTNERIAGHGRADTVQMLNQRYDAAG